MEFMSNTGTRNVKPNTEISGCFNRGLCSARGCVHAQSLQQCLTPWTVAHQVPLSMGFSRQKYWSGLLLPSTGDLTDPEIEPGSPAKSL